MRRGNRGISEVVAALMLVSITVAAAILIYVYSSGLLGSLQAAQPQQGQYTNQISLEFYDWTIGGCPPCQTLNLTVRNVGSGLSTVAAYYVSGVKITTTAGSCTTVGVLKPQNSCSVKLTIPGSLTITPGVAYLVKVATKDGGVFAYNCIAGQRTGSV